VTLSLLEPQISNFLKLSTAFQDYLIARGMQVYGKKMEVIESHLC